MGAEKSRASTPFNYCIKCVSFWVKTTNANKRREKMVRKAKRTMHHSVGYTSIHFIHHTHAMNILFIIFIINSIELYDSFYLQLVALLRLQVIKLDVIFSKRNRRIQMF